MCCHDYPTAGALVALGAPPLPPLTDASLAAFLGAERATVVVARAGCASCRRYVAEVEALLAAGALAGLLVGLALLDRPEMAGFARANRWLIGLDAPPLTLLYRDGAAIGTLSGASAAPPERARADLGTPAAPEVR